VSLPVRFSAEARSEFEDAAAWYEQQRPGLGYAFIDAVDATITLLVDWPLSGAPIDGLGADLEVRRAPVSRFPYHLAYLVADDHLRVLAVAHDRRRPRYWAARASR
jgi:plasmid stabilization system protein ParE